NGLPSDYTFTSGSGDDNGMHTFAATLVSIGSQSITATDTSSGTITGTQSSITVNPAAPSSLVVNGYPSTTTGGAPRPSPATIYATNGNAPTNYGGPVHSTSSDSKGTAGTGLPADSTFTTGVGGDNGVHVFTGTLKSVGSQSLTATDTVNSSI